MYLFRIAKLINFRSNFLECRLVKWLPSFFIGLQKSLGPRLGHEARVFANYSRPRGQISARTHHVTFAEIRRDLTELSNLARKNLLLSLVIQQLSVFFPSSIERHVAQYTFISVNIADFDGMNPR